MRRKEIAKSLIWVPVVSWWLFLAVGCNGSDANAISTTPLMLPATDSNIPTSNPDLRSIDPTLACPKASGVGTIPPTISIASITILVNGIEQVVYVGDTLLTSPNDQVQVAAATICASSLSGHGGQACVDFAPIDQSGQEIKHEHKGSHMVQVDTGFITISDIGLSWIIEENWSGFAAIVNHWPTEKTKDLACATGLCEQDDRIIIEFRQ